MGRVSCTLNWNVNQDCVHFLFRIFHASLRKGIRNQRPIDGWIFVARFGTFVRVGRKSCNWSSGSGDSCGLEHIQWVYVALRLADIFIR
jgi:hypothetical protein